MQQRGFSLFDVLVVLFLLVVLTGFLAPVYYHPHRPANRTKCASNLRQLGLAAVQYGDDKRFLPHVGKTKDLDGGFASSDTPRAVRAMVWYGYHDNPEGFICPSSDDLHYPVNDSEVLDNMRLWGWQSQFGEVGSTRNTTPPWKDGGAGGDQALIETTELSYAYTRRGYNRNVSSVKVLGADRALRASLDPAMESTLPGTWGNHDDGWNVVRADCTVDFVGYETELEPGQGAHAMLTGTNAKQGFLPLSPADRPLNR